MRFRDLCYRAHDPQWAFSPLSGDGAATHGGRFNPKGTAALYLALTIDGMFAETSRGFARRLDPLTVCTYDVDCQDVVDLRTDPTRAAAGVDLADMACAWALDASSRRIPASWAIAARLIGEGAAGILVPSFAVGARTDHANLVLWRWNDTPPHRVRVIDPDGRLPKSRASWL